jgi:acetyl-CoA C-acetyltransferase
MATGIKDKVAIIGMGCTHFGERWDMGAEELMVEAFEECLADAGIEKNISTPPGSGVPGGDQRGQDRHAPIHHPAAAHDPGHPGRELTAPPARRPFGGRYTAWPPAPTTSAWPWAWKSSRTPATAGCPVFGSDAGTLVWQWFPNLTAPGAFAQLASAYAAKYRFGPGSEAGHCPCVGQKPCQRRAQPQGALEKKSHQEQVMAAPSSHTPWGFSTAAGSATVRPAPSSPRRKSPRAWAKRISFRSRPCSWP